LSARQDRLSVTQQLAISISVLNRRVRIPGFLDRGAQIIYHIIYSGAIGARIGYEMHFSRSTIYIYYRHNCVYKLASEEGGWEHSCFIFRSALFANDSYHLIDWFLPLKGGRIDNLW
jgi:hypothetical protein